MATSAWLRGPSAMRLTEGLASVLKEQRPEYLPALLASYREHGVFQTQVRLRPRERRVSSAATSPVVLQEALSPGALSWLLCSPNVGDAVVFLDRFLSSTCTPSQFTGVYFCLVCVERKRRERTGGL